MLSHEVQGCCFCCGDGWGALRRVEEEGERPELRASCSSDHKQGRSDALCLLQSNQAVRPFPAHLKRFKNICTVGNGESGI